VNHYKALYASSQLEIAGLVDKINSLNPIIKENHKSKMYRVMLEAKDMAMCSNRYVWENLPINLTSQQLEGLFYRYGSLCFFVENGQLVISRYAMVGKLDKYGRLNEIQPIDFAGKAYGRKRGVINDHVEKSEDMAVIINDYTNDYQMVLECPRAKINADTTISDQLEVYRQLNTNIKLSVKKALALCDNEEQKSVLTKQLCVLLDSSNPIQAVAKNKDGLKGADLPLEMWNFDNNFDTQNYCQQIDYYDKVRRSFNGIPAPDTFEKKERKITSEAEDTSTHTQLVLVDGYLQRFNGLELIKKYLKGDGIDKINVKIHDLINYEKKEEEAEEEAKAEKEQENGYNRKL
jgi:hypothetical protein